MSESEEAAVSGDVEEKVNNAFRQEILDQEPSDAEKDALLAEHEGHLVRDTTSQLTETENVTDDGGIQMEKTAEVEDTYCFSCEEWVGTSGLDLTGTPRSRVDAYYLGGKPPEIQSAEEGVEKTLDELAEALEERVGHVDDRADAIEFIEAELGAMRNE